MPLGRLGVSRLGTPLPCPALGCQRASQRDHDAPQGLGQDRIRQCAPVHAPERGQSREFDVRLLRDEQGDFLPAVFGLRWLCRWTASAALPILAVCDITAHALLL